MAASGDGGKELGNLVMAEDQLKRLNGELWNLVTELQAANGDLRETNSNLVAAQPALDATRDRLQAENNRLRQVGEQTEERMQEVEEQLREAGLELDDQDRCPTPVAVVRPWPVASTEQSGKALWRAAKKGKIGDVRQLLANGADLTFKGGMHGTTALHEAASAGHTEILRLLIAGGMSLAATTHDHSTPLHYSLHKEPADCTALLIGAGAFVNATGNEGRTPLHDAVRLGHVQQVRLLVRAGAMGWARDDHGKTPYQLTRSKGIQALLPPP